MKMKKVKLKHVRIISWISPMLAILLSFLPFLIAVHIADIFLGAAAEVHTVPIAGKSWRRNLN